MIQFMLMSLPVLAAIFLIVLGLPFIVAGVMLETFLWIEARYTPWGAYRVRHGQHRRVLRSWQWFLGLTFLLGLFPVVAVLGAFTGRSWPNFLVGLAELLFLYAFFQAKKDFMMDIFSFSSDPEKLQEFFNQGPAERQALMFDAEQVKTRVLGEVIGQERVITEVVTTLARRIRLNRPRKPIATFLFVGPTGVGKTELAKALADAAFEGRMVRFDMGEFSQAHTAARLIGAPPGYQGSDKGGELTQAIFANRSGVLLLDEIEKADPEVYKLLLPLLDEGRITEASTGRTADASQFVIILTSNAAHEQLGTLADSITDPQELNRAVKDTLQKVFTPEQLARLDAIFCFSPLSRRSVAEIALKFLRKFATECGVEFAPGGVDSDLFIDFVLRQEKQASYGIRELVRLVESSVIDGFLEAKDAGFRTVKITMGDGIKVEGVA